MKRILFFATTIMFAINTSFAQKDWAQFNHYEKENAEIKTPADVVFMGNSITENWYKLDSTFFIKNNFAGRGISGQTTSQMLSRFRRDVIDLKPKAVVILAGINDIAQNNGYIKLENIMGNIVSMCELAKFNQIKVVLCTVLPCDHFFWRGDIKPEADIKRLNEMIKNYATNNKIPLVDYYTPFANEKGGMSEGSSLDGCHPVFNSYTIMEPLVVKGINQAIRSKKVWYTSKAM